MILNEDLIKELRDYLKIKTGRLYFKNIRQTSDNLLVTCPFHKQGQENKPSAGIRTTESQLTSIGTFHCFTCGETMGLSQVIQRLLGDVYDEDEVESRFQLNTLNVQSVIKQEQSFDLFELPNKNNFTYNELELQKYRYYHPYLAQRRISENTAKKYDIGFDNVNSQITFPLRDNYRHCLGIGRRSIDKKFYNYPQGMIKPLYGIYELPDKGVVHLWVVEGPFNLWSLNEWGKTGVALLGTGTEHQYYELNQLKCCDYILALDPDDAGRKGINKLSKYLQRRGKQEIYVALLPDGKDINDLTYDEFKQLQIVTIEEWRGIYNVNN